MQGGFFIVAEREGFEPPVPRGTPVFKTGVIDHSTIFPDCGCKITDKFSFRQIFVEKLAHVSAS